MPTTAPFLDLHAVHVIPPSLLIRDDTGRAKSSSFGGTRRDRGSSQGWKRPVRKYLGNKHIEGGAFGVRTTRLPKLVTAALTARGRDTDVAAQKTATAITDTGLSANATTGNTAASVYAPAAAAGNIADIIDVAWDNIVDAGDKKGDKGKATPPEVIDQIKAALDPGTAIDIALFGRMLAEIDNGARDVDGAVLFAHPLGVAAAQVEADFFTTVDDKPEPGEAVSSNLGTTDLTAPVLYRYASLNWRQLAANLGGAAVLTKAAGAAFIDGFTLALPSGKQTSTGATTLPEYLIGIASRRATSYANAFANAITATDVVPAATEALFNSITRGVRFQEQAQIIILPITADPAALPTIPGATVVGSLDEFTAAAAAAADLEPR